MDPRLFLSEPAGKLFALVIAKYFTKQQTVNNTMMHFITPKHHWNYFFAIEEDLKRMSRYIEFCEDNLGTYSIELAHILLSASSEIDVVLKQLCNLLAPGGDYENIDDYRQTIRKYAPNFSEEKVQIPRLGLSYCPWENWKDDRNPGWWKSYNKVKHERNLHYAKANLQNTINAVSALLIAVVYYYKYAFAAERGQDVSFRDTTRQLESSLDTFMFLQTDYYYQRLIM